MNEIDILVASSLGLGLAAASGFRVFIPPFLYGLFLRLDMVPISIPMTGISEWMASDIGLIILGVAMIVEILGYYVPWIDNLLDTIASPAAIIAGVMMMSSTLSDTHPALQWGASIIAGGGVSGTVQIGTVATRAVSTATTGGLANPIVSTIEAGACIVCTILAILLPLIALLLVIILVGYSGKQVNKRFFNNSSNSIDVD
ncbi:MAG: DUF4126 domain-containing protein [Candidatus Thermoplasmatota archaeon]|nr:DUF4126 domain-containing protein [Candidatus Thermoplasmatota archaeon]MEC8720857.1 DUF4126 domain-containing protein [Candidatus Thermoplasmatota archaeon]MEC9118916.1 DUF4126 domain-containing protein [Candidatus Thermoplasmatota archaeon]